MAQDPVSPSDKVVIILAEIAGYRPGRWSDNFLENHFKEWSKRPGLKRLMRDFIPDPASGACPVLRAALIDLEQSGLIVSWGLWYEIEIRPEIKHYADETVSKRFTDKDLQTLRSLGLELRQHLEQIALT